MKLSTRDYASGSHLTLLLPRRAASRWKNVIERAFDSRRVPLPGLPSGIRILFAHRVICVCISDPRARFYMGYLERGMKIRAA